jgi:outer membrane protein OmpA-like peptidoglycan-associated protein
MAIAARNRRRWSHCYSIAVGICLLISASLAAAASSQSGQTVPPQDAVQTAPINEPRAAQHKPTGPPIVKGAGAIKQTDAKCSTTLTVADDALFQPRRWTLNPDAGQTMNALGPMIAKAGKRPVRIESFTDSADSDSYSQMLSEKRAITVRGWLVNHGYVPEGTPIEGLGQRNPVAPNAKPDGSDDPEGRQKNRRIVIVIDTCSESK